MIRPVPRIADPAHPPDNARRVGQVVDVSRAGASVTRTFFIIEGVLVILSQTPAPQETDPVTGAPVALLHQVEFPKATAPWLVGKVEPFIAGGALPGALFRFSETLDGEVIHLNRAVAVGGRGVPGWLLTNASRKAHGDDTEPYRDWQTLAMSDTLMESRGLWSFWTEFADKVRWGLR